jgi:hypothetical protein
MNLEVLEYIVDHAVERIEELADECSVDSSASIGVAKMLLFNNGDLSKLSEKQAYHYENCIKPLIERVQCEGVFGPMDNDDTCGDDDGIDGSTCSGDGYIDDESLMGCYLEDEFQCQFCRYDSERIAEE